MSQTARGASASGPPEPRNNPDLIGHDGAEQSLLQAWRSGRMPHAWLIEGPPGIGKATLAYRFARFVLAQKRTQPATALFQMEAAGLGVSKVDSTFRLVAANSHPDLLVVERQYDEKRKRDRRVIRVDETREIAQFLHLTPSQGGWRVVIVDGAEEMNRNAENSILKVLEEPPAQALILLVSHASGQLLATVRSRCRRLQLRPLPPSAVEGLLARYAPDLPEAERQPTVRLAAGSIGRALALIEGGGLELYRAVVGLLERIPGMDVKALHGLADKTARAGAEDVFATVTELYFTLLRRVMLEAGGAAEVGEILPGEAALLRRLARRRSLDRWLELWDNSRRLVARTDSINLDRKQVILNVFLALEDERA
ncbi:MAG: DNA polymerase III subunit delta' [Proteobacteria bacterium]|nr:DNA polymerase III subunit delta' [Pseudomonadota bacterium]MBI3496081.1 DNA polymerase III subunit delta' [Pseudomonadota bacterium]